MTRWSAVLTSGLTSKSDKSSCSVAFLLPSTLTMQACDGAMKSFKSASLTAPENCAIKPCHSGFSFIPPLAASVQEVLREEKVQFLSNFYDVILCPVGQLRLPRKL